LLIALAAVYGFFWVGGVGAYWIFGGPPAHVSWTAPLFLGLAGVLVIAASALRDWPRMLLCSGTGFLAEILGVHTSVPFGAYAYSNVLSPNILGVPIVMIAAWLILLTYIQEMLRAFRLSLWIHVGAASVWMTAIDFVIDPLAAGPLNYWTWEHPGWYYGIPATNFLGWLLVSMLAFTVAGPSWRPNRCARWVGLSVIAFFVCVALATNLILAAMIGLALCGVHGGVLYVQSRGDAKQDESSDSCRVT
jgi:putative membrane protein